ncbi:hypothetical protein [Paraburkholderia fungorum]|uniref:hypothetical protein n=1 Tax=Paraburkholderia fungorum TaxID=134537 RepID=UPI000482ECA2|nr:hypothetical protein [Paraburkholderia fungorum]MBB5546669.1 hypothetical protein [Paraburkholderia fungorum]
MGMFFDEAAGDRLIGLDDGVKGALAVQRAGSQFIEIWCEEGETRYGSVPASFTVEDINHVLRFYHTGVEAGIAEGELKKQIEVRRVLGLL